MGKNNYKHFKPFKTLFAIIELISTYNVMKKEVTTKIFKYSILYVYTIYKSDLYRGPISRCLSYIECDKGYDDNDQYLNTSFAVGLSTLTESFFV